jgi:hypothetical protein
MYSTNCKRAARKYSVKKHDAVRAGARAGGKERVQEQAVKERVREREIKERVQEQEVKERVREREVKERVREQEQEQVK